MGKGSFCNVFKSSRGFCENIPPCLLPHAHKHLRAMPPCCLATSLLARIGPRGAPRVPLSLAVPLTYSIFLSQPSTEPETLTLGATAAVPRRRLRPRRNQLKPPVASSSLPLPPREVSGVGMLCAAGIDPDFPISGRHHRGRFRRVRPSPASPTPPARSR